jgi:hypothetical protein
MKRIPCFLLALLVLAALCAVPFGTGCKPTKIVEVEFPVRQPDPNQVAQLRDEEKQQLAGYEPGKVEKAVLEAYTTFNKKTVGDEHSRAELEEDIKRIRVASKMCLEQGGQKRLAKLITWLLVRFEESLEELLAAADSKAAVAALLSGSKPPEKIKDKFDEFTGLGGDFIQNAYNAGLLRPGKKDGIELAEGGQFFVRLAFKVRWAMILPEATRPLSWLLTGFESRWYDIWTVERSKTATLSRKLKAVKRLKGRNPAYRDHTARGIVYYQNRDFKRSLKCFELAAKEHPGDQHIQKFMQAAKRRL